MNKLTLTIGGVIVTLGFGVWIFLGSGANDTVVPEPVVTPSETAEVKIIAFGDSLTAGYGLSQSEAYPAQLEAALRTRGHNVEVINSGVSGETTRGNLERAHFIKDQNPDIVLLGIGGNDALRFLAVTETEKNLRATIDILQSASQPPIIALLEMQAPVNAGAQYKKDFDSLYGRLSAEEGLLRIPFITAEIFGDQANKIPDGIHFNAAGYKKVVDQYIVPALEEVLETARDRLPSIEE